MLSQLNVGDYFETTTMSYLYMLDLSEKDKRQQDMVEKGKEDKLEKRVANSDKPKRLPTMTGNKLKTELPKKKNGIEIG